jgi:peptide/nickel transport system ATP-binding protein
MMPPLTELPSGCAFRPRCPYATAECGEIPETRPYGAVGQSIRCFHPLSPPEESP